MSTANNATLNFYALKLAIAIQSEDGNDFCTEYDLISRNKLTQQQLDWIKEKARSDSELPKATLKARMRWYNDKVIPSAPESETSSQPNNPFGKPFNIENSVKLPEKSTNVAPAISEKTESEYQNAVNNLKARMNSMVDNPIMKSYSSGSYSDAKYGNSLTTSDVNKNYSTAITSDERACLFNGFHEDGPGHGNSFEMKEIKKKEYTEISIDDAIDFRLKSIEENQGESEENNLEQKKWRKKEEKKEKEKN